MATWYKRHKNGSSTFTTRSDGKSSISSSSGNKNRRETTTRRSDGSVVRTITERNSAGQTRRTRKTLVKKRK